MLTGHAFPRHSHDQFGIGVLTVGAQRSWSVLGEVESSAGDVIMVNPGEMHDGAPLGGLRGWHILYVDPSIVSQELSAESRVGDLTLRPVVRDPQIATTLAWVFSELETKAPDRMAVEEAVIGSVLRVVQKHCVDGAAPRRSTPPVIRAVQRLESAPQRSTSLSELAAVSGVSRFQLVRGFSRETGTTPHAYLLQLRVRLARRFLAAGESPADAALLAGFADQSHLTRAFVRQLGVTPGRYQAATR